jgi:dienelactone hydrolase
MTALPAAAMDRPLERRSTATAEPLPGVETVLGELQAPDGYRLRTMVTRPADTRRRLPAVYYVQWLSCDSVEIGLAEDGWNQMLRSLVSESGMVVMRLEKAGVGDSEGGPCSELDYETELRHHRLAFRALHENAWVDPGRVFVFGASMGATFAPLVAEQMNVKGVAVWGGGARSWFERQLAFERNAMELGGASGEEIDERMRMLSRFYSALLLDRQSPAQISARDPELGSAWSLLTGADGATQVGRPVGCHQQAQARRWATAWSALQAPVLALLGEYDWYETRESVELIGEVINQRSPGLAQVHVFPGVDHHFTRYRSARDAYAGRDGEADAAVVMALLLSWLKKHAR